LSFGARLSSQFDVTNHLMLYDGGTGNRFGFNVSYSGVGFAHLNYVVLGNADHVFSVAGAVAAVIDNSGIRMALSSAITLGGDPTADLHAVPRQWVTANFAPISGGGYVQKSGDVMIGPLSLPVGSVTVPSLNFGQTNTGFYAANNQIFTTITGVLKLTVSNSTLTSTNPIRTADGTATAPGFAFGSDTLSGIYKSASFTIGFTTAGVLRLSISTLAITSTLPIVLPGDPTTGLHAVPRQWLDNNYSNNTQGDARWVNVGGDTMTGSLIVTALTVVGRGAATAAPPSVNTDLQIVGRASGGSTALTLESYAGGTQVIQRRANGTAASPLAIASGDALMSFRTAGYDGSAWTVEQISVSTFADEAWTSTAQGRRTSLWTVPNGTGAHVERLRIDNAGIVMIGQTATVGTAILQVNGGLSLTSGDATLFRDPSAPLHAVPRQWLDNNYLTIAQSDARFVNIDGDTMVGPLIITGVTPLTNPVIISANTVLPAAPAQTELQVIGRDNLGVRITVDGYAGTPQFTGRRASGTAAAPSAVSVNDILFALNCFGYGTTGYSPFVRATFGMVAAEVWSDTANGTYFSWNTTAIGGIVSSEKMRLSDAGALRLYNDTLTVQRDPNAALEVVTKQYFESSGDTRWVNVSGDRMDGGLSFGSRFAPGTPGNPTLPNPNDTTNHISLYDGWAGFSMTGGALNVVASGSRVLWFDGNVIQITNDNSLYLAHDPTQPLEAVNRQWALNNFMTPDQGDLRWLQTAGGKMTGTLEVAPGAYLQMSDSIGTGYRYFVDAGNKVNALGTNTDGSQRILWTMQLRQNFAQIQYRTNIEFITGSNITIPDPPTTGAHAANMTYVDGAVTRAGGPFLPLTAGPGNQLTGMLSLKADWPTLDEEATNKSFVDGQIALLEIKIGALAQNLVFVGQIHIPTDQTLFTLASGIPPPPPATNVPMPLPPATSVPKGFYVIVVTPGSPPAGSNIPPGNYVTSDWLVNDGAEWVWLQLGLAYFTADQIALLPTINGKSNVQQISQWLFDYKLNIAGGTLTGQLYSPFTPSTGIEVANMAYVDSKVGGAVTSFNNRTGAVSLLSTDITDASGLLITGGDMLGDLLLNADPTASRGAVTKQYSDRNKVMTNIDMTFGVATPPVDQVDFQSFYLYGTPTVPTLLNMPIATSQRRLWNVWNATTQPVTVKGVASSGGAVVLPPFGAAHVVTDTANVSFANSIGATRAVDDNTTWLATTEFVTRAGGAFLKLSGGTMFGPLHTTSYLDFNNGVAPSNTPQDLSRGIVLWGSTSSGYGFAITSSTLNYNVVGGTSYHDFYADNTLLFRIQGGNAVTSYLPMFVRNFHQVNATAGVGATLLLNNGGGNSTSDIQGYNSGSLRWIVRLGGAANESGGPTGNAGSEFSLFSYRNDGAFLGEPFYITRTTTGGDGTFTGNLYVNNDPVQPTGAVTLRYLQTNYLTTAQGDLRWINANGDTMTGQLNIANNSASLVFKDTGGGDVRFIIGADDHFGLYSTNAAGASAVTVWDFYVRQDAPSQTFSLETYFQRFTHHNGGLSWAGGDFRQGSIYTDGNWGGLFRGYAGVSADLAFADRDGNINFRIRQNLIELWAPTTFGSTITANALVTMTNGLSVISGTTQVKAFRFSEQSPGPLSGGGYGALTWNTDGGGDVAFVNGCNWASAGFSWYQVLSPSGWQRIMYLNANGNLYLAGCGVSYVIGGAASNVMGFNWSGSRVNAYVDNNLIGALATTGDLGSYLALSGGVMTGAIQFNNSGMVNSISQGPDGVGPVNNNIKISSWWGVGFHNQVGAGTIPAGQAGVYFDCRNGVGYFTGLNVSGDTATHNIYHDGNVGIMYRGVGGADWFAFKWDGTNSHIIVNGWDSGNVAVQSWVTANFAPAGVGGAYVAKTGDIMSGGLQINYTPTDTWAQLWIRPQAGNAGTGTIRFSGTFGVGVPDTGPRYISSIRSGLTGGWATEYLDIWINNGGTNDSSQDANQVRSTRFTRGGVDVNGYAWATGNVGANALVTMSGQVIMVNNPAYYFERRNSDGWWRFVEGNTPIFYVDNVGNATITGTATVNGAATIAGAATFNGQTYFKGINPQINIDGPANTYRTIQWYSAGAYRWNIQAEASNETGGDVGSDLIFTRWTDTQAPGAILRFQRSTGRLLMQGGPNGDTIQMTTPQTQPARYVSTVANIHTWSAGTFVDGSYTIGDETRSVFVLAMSGTNGNAVFSNRLQVNGQLAVPNSGLTFGQRTTAGDNPLDLTQHIQLWEPNYGFSVTSGTLNVVAGGKIDMYPNGTVVSSWQDGGLFLQKGDITLFRDPSANMHAVTRQWAQANFAPVVTGGYVAKSGDNMTGALGVVNTFSVTGAANVAATIWLNPANGKEAQIISSRPAPAGIRWHIQMGDGQNTDNFLIHRYDDTGHYIDAPLTINRATSALTMPGVVTAGAFSTNGTLTANSGATVGGLYSTAGMTAAGRMQSNDIMNISGAFFIGNNTDYYLARGGDGAWRFVENTVTNLTIDAAGGLTPRGNITCNNGSIYSNTLVRSDGNIDCQATGIRYLNLATNHGFNFRWDNTNILGRVDNAVEFQLSNQSDERLKADIAPSTFDCLAAVLATPLFQFRWKDGTVPGQALLATAEPREDAPLVPIGFVAQRQHAVFPESVYAGSEIGESPQNATRVWSMDHNTLCATLFGAIKQLVETNAALVARVETLERRTLH
jgi:hypothetical protein